MTDDYLSHLAVRCQEWREKYPRRAVELRRFAMRSLGIQPTNTSKLAAAAIEQTENELIRTILGWPTENEWDGGPKK